MCQAQKFLLSLFVDFRLAKNFRPDTAIYRDSQVSNGIHKFYTEGCPELSQALSWIIIGNEGESFVKRKKKIKWKGRGLLWENFIYVTLLLFFISHYAVDFVLLVYKGVTVTLQWCYTVVCAYSRTKISLFTTWMLAFRLCIWHNNTWELQLWIFFLKQYLPSTEKSLNCPLLKNIHTFFTFVNSEGSREYYKPFLL